MFYTRWFGDFVNLLKAYGTDLVTKFLHFLLLRNAMPKIFPTILDTLVKFISYITKKYSWFLTYYLCYIRDNLVISLTYWRLMEQIWSPNFYIFCSCETQCLTILQLFWIWWLNSFHILQLNIVGFLPITYVLYEMIWWFR